MLSLGTVEAIVEVLIAKYKESAVENKVRFLAESSTLATMSNKDVTVNVTNMGFKLRVRVSESDDAFLNALNQASTWSNGGKVRHTAWMNPSYYKSETIEVFNMLGPFSKICRNIRALSKWEKQAHRERETARVMELVNKSLNLDSFLLEKNILSGDKE